MLHFDVFGRRLGVKKVSEQWLLYRVDPNEGKYSRIYDVVIPAWLTEEELPAWLGDIYHEAASEKHPDVRLINAGESSSGKI
ncbi:hypothetical protein F3J28_08710 [Enterobacter sp. Ap-1006]|uniref:DUF7661 family protein n=1 Tax=Enterobacter sp. Ap-1006 TaxID=2608345 RepID=UPI00141F2BC2|nr:hypothetical protein [Enterobacter sp. Ap-1006]NIF47847.1 hypothetical protein [Enterobacter sp. Ap-1006]